MKRSVTLILLSLLCLPLPVLAELPKQVEADFAVLKGLIVMPAGDEYLVDLDASDGLQEGDILTVVTPGEKIIHPETQEVIGSVDIPAGYLQVTRIKSGYSYAKPLSAETRPADGAALRRFEQVPTRFADAADNGPLLRQLQLNLPQLKWLPEDAGGQALLTFMAAADTLEVKTSDGSMLHRYALADDQQLEASAAPVRRPYVASGPKSEPKMLQKFANSIMGTFGQNRDDDFARSGVGIIRTDAATQKGVWIGPNLSGSPAGMVVADLDGDGMQETAVALDHTIQISQIRDGESTLKVEIPTPSQLQLLSLDAIDLDKDGQPELCLTALGGFQLSSFVIQFRNGNYETIIDNVNWYLRVIELHDDNPVLIGQRFGSDEKSYSGPLFFVKLEGDQLVRGDDIAVPKQINIFNFIPFRDNENRLNYAYLTPDDYLAVVSVNGEKLWESSEYFGGSEICFENRKPFRGDMVAPTCIPPRMIKTTNKGILVARNEGQRIMERYHKFKNSSVYSFRWNGFALEEKWRTAGQRGYLGDLDLADADNDGVTELAMVIKFKHSGIIDEARSAVVTYELQ